MHFTEADLLCVELNPNGKVPTIRIGNFVLWESNSILRYLYVKYGKELVDLESQALVDQWTEWSHEISQEMMFIYPQMLRTPEKDWDVPKLQDSLKKLNDKWKILDEHLGNKKTDFIMGDSLTVADVAVGSFLHRYYNMKIERPHLKNVEAWHKRLAKREGFKEFVQVDLL